MIVCCKKIYIFKLNTYVALREILSRHIDAKYSTRFQVSSALCQEWDTLIDRLKIESTNIDLSQAKALQDYKAKTTSDNTLRGYKDSSPSSQHKLSQHWKLGNRNRSMKRPPLVDFFRKTWLEDEINTPMSIG
jgi:hypothetical protein